MRSFFNLYFFCILVSTLFSDSKLIGIIDKVEGNVIMKSHLSTKGITIPIVGDMVFSRDQISTGSNGEIEISFEGSYNLLTIFSDSDLGFKDSKSAIDFILNYGSILVQAKLNQSLKHNLFTENTIVSLVEGECFLNRSLSNKDQIYILRGDATIKNFKNSSSAQLTLGEFIKSDSDSLHNKENIKEGILPNRIYNKYKFNIDLINSPSTFTIMNDFSNELIVNNVKREQKINYISSLENLSVQNENYLKISLFPKYKHQNTYSKFLLGYNFSGFISSSDSSNNLNNLTDLSYLLAPIVLEFNSKKSGNMIQIGKVDELSFGYGTLISNFTNSIYPPIKQDAGLSSVIYSKAGRNKIKIFLSSFIDAVKGGALSGLYYERRTGDNGMLLGMGLVVDQNQFQGAIDTLWGEDIIPHTKNISGITFNTTYRIKSSLRNDTYLFGEVTSLFYNDKLRYIRSEMIDSKIIQQGYERTSSFGFKGPGIWWKIGHHKNLKVALNYSSALYTSPFFSRTYSLERGYYILSSIIDSLEKNEPYSADEEWNNMIKSNIIDSDSSKYYLPKDIYMLLDPTNNVHSKIGFSFNYDQSYRKYFNFKFNFDSFKEFGSIESPSTFYNLGIELAINNGLIKNISNFEVYFNQYFTSSLLEHSKYSENMIMGAKLEINILKNISLKIYRHDVFYDNNIDGEVDLNSTMGIGLVAKYK